MNKLQANLCLITVTLCWSCEVILLKNIPDSVSEFAITTMTNLIGCIILGAIFLKHIKSNFSTVIIREIAILAVFNVTYNLLIIYSLKHLDVATGIFALTMPTVIMPMILFACKKRIKKQVWLGVLLVLAGIVNSLDLSFPREQTIGIGLVLIYSVVHAVYIIKLNIIAKKYDTFVISTLILGFVACFSFILWFITDPKTFFNIEYSPQMLSSVFLIGYFICAFATLINIFAQEVVSPVSASVIYSLYTVFSIILVAVLPPILINVIPITFQMVLSCLCIAFGAFTVEADWSVIKRKLQKIMS